MEYRIEDKDICKKCGGYCCKKCGCDYFVSDFENIKIDVIENALSTGKVSIVAMINFKTLSNGGLAVEPLLYLRSRNINRGEIDLLSFKTTCAQLTSEGCSYDIEHRPSGGASLIPSLDQKGHINCYSEVDRLKEVKKWIPYQSILQKVVKRHTGMGVYTKLKIDTENLFFDLLTKNFDGVAKEELVDVLGMAKLLCQVYPEEYKKAKTRSDAKNVLIYKKRKFLD